MRQVEGRVKLINALVRIDQLYTTFNLPHINQVYMLFLGQLDNLDFSPGAESLETVLFSESDIPWNDLAFPVVHETLKYYFQDLAKGHFLVRVGDICWHTRGLGNYKISLLGECD